MSTSTKVIPMTASDVSDAVDVLYHQKISLAINRVMWKTWPDEVVQRARVSSAVEGSINSSSSRNFKVVDNETERLLGVLVLTRLQPSDSGEVPKAGKPSKQEDKLKSSAPAGLDLKVSEEVVKALEAVSENVAGLDQLEITALVVVQSVRRKGLGSQLMEAAFETSRAEKVPLVVCSEPESNDFFVKLGFREVKHFDMDLSEFATPFSGFGTFRFTKMIWPEQ